MKKFLLFLFSMVLMSSAILAFEEVNSGASIYFDKETGKYSTQNKTSDVITIKTNKRNFNDYYVNNELLDSTKTDYAFINNGKFILYSGDEFKFYEMKDNEINELSKGEVQQLFPDYEIVLISKFDYERKYSVSKSFFEAKKILVLNDTNRTFHDFFVYPETSRNAISENAKNGAIKSLITIYGKKNVRIKHSGGDEFEIVVR